MDNKTEFFTLKEDGVIVWIENHPGDLRYWSGSRKSYDRALQSAMSSAMEVANRSVVESELEHAHGVLEINKPYPLQCHVEKKESWGPYHENTFPETVALVTFSEPEEKDLSREEMDKLWASIGPSKEIKFNEVKPSAGVEETQEELWKQMFQQIGSRMDFMKFLLEHYTITRKNK